MTSRRTTVLALTGASLLTATLASGHGTVVSPVSRVYRVYQANPDNPSFQLAANAVAIDGTLSYYTWNELSRNLPQAVQAGLPPGFDYSPWVPDGQLASGGRVDPNSPDYPRTYAGLDQVSSAWPTTAVTAGATIEVDFLATAAHDPSAWDVWMTTPDWDPSTPLTWAEMEFLGRPQPVLAVGHYTFDLAIPTDRIGHHVIWIAWHRDDPVGEVFFSTSDVDVRPPAGPGTPFCVSSGNSVTSTGAEIFASGSASVAANDLVLHAAPLPTGQFGLAFHGAAQIQQPFGEGVRCVASSLVRIQPAGQSDAAGFFASALDNTSPAGAGIAPGATRHFQVWYRDTAGGPSGFNLTNGLSVSFAP